MASVREREQDWLAEQSLEDLRKIIYFRLPIVLAANDLEGRKPFLALERLIELATGPEDPVEAPPE